MFGEVFLGVEFVGVELELGAEVELMILLEGGLIVLYEFVEIVEVFDTFYGLGYAHLMF